MAKRLPKERTVRKWQALPAKTQARINGYARSEWLKNPELSGREIAKLILDNHFIAINHKTVATMRKGWSAESSPVTPGELITQPENWTPVEAATVADNLKRVAHWLEVIDKQFSGSSSLDRLLKAGSEGLTDRFKMQKLLAHFVTNWLGSKGMEWIPDTEDIKTVLAALRIVMLNEHELTRLASVIADNVDRTAPEAESDTYQSGIDWNKQAPEPEPVKPAEKKSKRKAKHVGQITET